MKLKTITLKSVFMAATLLLATACDDVIVDTSVKDAQEDVTTTQTGKLVVDCSFEQTVTSFAATRDGDVAVTPSKTLADTVNYVYYVIFKNDRVYKTVTQYKTDTDFGKLDIDLEEGSYTLAMLANKDNEGTSLEISNDGIVSIDSKKPRITETFSYAKNIDISLNARTSVKAQLCRCVAMVNFTSKDKYPDDITSMKITYNKVATKYDLLNSTGSNVGTMSRTIDLTGVTSIRNEDGYFNTSIYLYVPGSESKVDITLSFYNKSNTLLYTRELNNITIKENHKTNVAVTLFTDAGTEVPTISFDYNWGEDLNQSFD